MVISLPYIFQVLYALCFTRPRYQVSVYRTNGPLVFSWRGEAYSLFVFVHRMFKPLAECLYVSLLSIYCMDVSLCYLICSPILEDNK